MGRKKRIVGVLFASVVCLSLTGCQEQTSAVENSPGKTQILVSGATRIKTNSTSKLRTVVYGPSASVVWSSADTSIATIAQDGTVKGLKPGFVTLTATSVNSTETNPISTSYTVLIEPDYLDSMITTALGYSWNTGVQFLGSATVGISSTVSTSVAGLATVKIDNTTKKGSIPVLVNSSISADSLNLETHLAYLGDDSIYAYNWDDNKDFTAFKKYSFSQVASLLLSFNIFSLSDIDLSGISFDPSSFDINSLLDYTTIAGTELNKYVTFSSDINTGVSLSNECISNINTKITDFKNEYKDSSSLLSLLSSIIPDSITSFNLTTNSSYSDYKIKIGGKTGTDSFNFVDGTITKSPTVIASDYFDNLKTTLTALEPEADFISDMNYQASSISDILSERKNNIYDSINFSSNFSSEVSDYNDSYSTISESSNPGLYTDLKQYGPYIYTQVTDEAGNILPDKTFAKVGTTYKISSPKVAGTSTTPDISSYSIEVSESLKDVCTYTYDSTAGTLVFTSLPAGGSSLTVSLTPKSATDTSLVPVSYTFRAPK